VIYPRLTGFSAGLPPLLALLFGLLAAIWPACPADHRVELLDGRIRDEA
jgi:hypothetical protein